VIDLNLLSPLDIPVPHQFDRVQSPLCSLGR
jgi:hypothetical protein